MNKKLCSLLLVSALAGCATVPTGPTVAVMPAPGKPFEVFTQEDAQCRNFAASSSGANRNETTANNMAGNMALGTVLGAVAGTLIGGNHQGTGVGAGVGLLAGTAVGSSQGGGAGYDVQSRYNIAYQQCMYAKGNQLPGQIRGNYAPPPRL